MNKIEIIELAKSLGISNEDFVMLSSSGLVIRDILENAGDLDIAVTQKGLEELHKKYSLKQKDNGWYIVNDNVECVLDDMEGKKEKIGEFYLHEINDYLDYLESSNREKDKLRIPLVKEYIGRTK